MYKTLIGTADLAQALQDPQLLVVDCRFELGNPAAGEAAFRESHIPNAIYAHLDRDLAGPVTANTGRHPLPSPEQFAALLGTWGVQANTQVIAYDNDNSMYAARLWWLLRWVGHAAIAVLDGGFKAWLAAGLPISKAPAPARARTTFEPRADRSRWLDATEVAAKVQNTDWRLLDVRAAERFAGEVEPIDPVAGHVPGARNHPFANNLSAQGRFLPAEQLRANFELSQAGVADDRTIVMCGSGVTACQALLALEVAGKPGARLYAGSWSDWIRDPQHPVARGRA